MASYEYLDQTGLQYTLNKLKTVISNGYVAQEEGKGLSANDLTDELLEKLNGIAAEATKTTVSNLQTTGNVVGRITITTPTGSTNYDIKVPEGQSIVIDKAMSDTSENPVENKVIKKYVDDAVGAVVGIEFVVAPQLPETGENGKIYLIPNGGSGSNVKDEYVWIVESGVGRFEKIGTTDIDLSGYVQKTDLGSMSTTEIDTVFSVVFPTT